MDWEQKLMALNALVDETGGVHLFMRKPGDWGCLVRNVNRKEGSMSSSGGLSGKTPQAAVESAWDWATDQKFYMVIGYGGSRKAVRWNGFMWAAAVEDKS